MSHQYFLTWLKDFFTQWPSGGVQTLSAIKLALGHRATPYEIQWHMRDLQVEGLARIKQGLTGAGEVFFEVLPPVVIDTTPQPVWIDTSNPSHPVNHAQDRLYVGCEPGDKVTITVEQLLWLLEKVGGNKRVAARKVTRSVQPFIELMRESDNWVPELLGAYPKI